jgi:hypothetical protein
MVATRPRRWNKRLDKWIRLRLSYVVPNNIGQLTRGRNHTYKAVVSRGNCILVIKLCTSRIGDDDRNTLEIVGGRFHLWRSQRQDSILQRRGQVLNIGLCVESNAS